MTKTILPAILLWCIALLYSCTKQTEDLSFPVEPDIILDSISSDLLTEFQDSLILYVSYQDGDGDLGTSDPDVNSVFIRDRRLSAADAYYLPPLAPEDQILSIQGQLTIEVPSVFLFGNGTEETTVFTLSVIDRAGNESNAVQTPEITIVRE